MHCSGPYRRNTTAIQEKIFVLQLYCSSIALVRTALERSCLDEQGMDSVFTWRLARAWKTAQWCTSPSTSECF